MIFDGIRFRRAKRIGFRVDAHNPYVRFYTGSGREIPLDGHSRTDMAYAADGRVLLARDGRVYTARPAAKRRGRR